MLRRRLTFLTLVLAPILADPAPPTSPPARPVLMVVGSGPVRTGDEALRQQLEARGYSVLLKDDSSARLEDLDGELLILISSSVSEPWLGARFREVAVPLVVLAPLLYDDLGMASGRLGEDYGFDSMLGRRGLEIVQPDHALAGGLSGQVAISKRPADFGWALPAPDAIVAAQVGDGSPRATVFAYEAGTALVGLEAPARRVGLFVTEDVAPFLTREGWTLFDAAIDWAAGVPGSVEPAREETVAPSPDEEAARVVGFSGPSAPLAPQTALFVVGNLTLNSGDTSARTRLENLGFTLTIKTGAASTTADATGQTVVVISSTVNPTDVNTKFRNVTVPVVTWESSIFDDMKMTGTTTSDFGTQTTETQVTIVAATHPLAGGLSGSPVVSASSTFAWGRPSAGGVKVATMFGTASRGTILGYETGASMVGLTAPARRVGLFLQDATALTANGGTLFDAAINWAANRPPLVTAGPDQTITLPSAATLAGTATDDGRPIPPGSLTTTWSKVSGTGTVTFGDASSVSTTATFSTSGPYVLRLTATDGQTPVTDDVGITVNAAPPNVAPAVNAGPDLAVTRPQSAALHGTVTDDGKPNPPAAVTIGWTKVSGPGTVTFANPAVADTTATFSLSGTYVVRLTGNDSALSTTNDATVVVSDPPADTLFVVGNATLTAADAAVKVRLEGLGRTVFVKAANASLVTADANGRSLLVISSTVSPTSVGNKFTSVAVPLVTWESHVFDDLGMTNGVLDTDFGTIGGLNNVSIFDAEHPLAYGLSGIVTVSETGSTFNWGVPTPAAARVVDLEGYGLPASFGYDTGAPMVGLTAPARRVGFFFGDTTAASASPAGWMLFDGAVKWAMSIALPVVAAPTFDKASGAYPAGEEVIVTDATPAAVIHYTIDGGGPTPNDPAIASGGGITLGNFTLKARAWSAGSLPSATTSAAYTITGQFGPGAVAAGDSHSLGVRPDGVVWAWGSNTYGQLGTAGGQSSLAPVPVSGATGVKAISAGNAFSVALRADGTVWGWGDNSYGQLGTAALNPQPTPIAIAGLTGVAQISAGGDSIVALKDDGSVWAIGQNWYGQLGNGSTIDSDVPVQVSGLVGVTIVAVSAGGSHALALDNLGNVRAWGQNYAGQAGDGNVGGTRLSPVPVANLTDVTAISAGSNHNLAVKGDGTVWGWGANSLSQAGQPNWNPAVSPPQQTSITPPPPGLAVAGGGIHSIAVIDGSTWAWGDDTYGQFGCGSCTIQSATPIPVYEVSDVIKVAAGSVHTLALTADGSVWAWGGNFSGQLGNGTLDLKDRPVKIAEAGMNWKVGLPVFSPDPGPYPDPQTVTVSSATSGATFRYTTDTEDRDPVETDPPFPPTGLTLEVPGTLLVKAWKDGYAPSDTAYGSYEFIVEPVVFSPPPGTYASTQQVTLSCLTPGATIQYSTDGVTWQPYTGPINVSTTTTIQAQADRTGWYSNWSYGTYQMNFGTLDPPVISPAGGPYVGSVAVTMAAAPGATIRYTIDGSEPQSYSILYQGPASITETATLKARAFHQDYVTSATAAAIYTIDLAAPTFTPNGGAYPLGQTVMIVAPTLGAVIHYTINGADPIEADPILPSGTVLTLTESLTLKAKAWKSGCTPSSITSATYTISGGAVAGHVAAGDKHTLAAASDGSLWTWGDNSDDQLGDGSGQDRLLPSAVPAAADVVAVAGGAAHSLALRTDGSVLAWGLNDEGQLGNNSRTGVVLPAAVQNLSGVAAIATGAKFSLALKDGTVWAWGDNSSGQLGLGNTTDSLVPVPVPGLTGIIAIAAGDLHSLAVKSNGLVYSWGANTTGQLGIGSILQQNVPIQVAPLSDVTQVAAGAQHSLALIGDGTVRAWGGNSEGQVGDASGLERRLPVSVGGVTGVRMVESGRFHSLAIKADGSLWAWGKNGSGQLGDGTMVRKLAPSRATGIGGIVRADGGNDHTVALAYDGTVWAFGGQRLGDGTVEQQLSAVPVSEPNFDWKSGRPTFIPPAGAYNPISNQSVTMSSVSADATIHYTLDGTEPTGASPSVASGGLVTLDRSGILKARTVVTGEPSSNVTGGLYTLKVLQPLLSPGTGTYPLGQQVTVTSPTQGATLHYTIDGTTPTESDPVVISGAAITIDSTTDLMVGAWRSGWEPSPPAFGLYTATIATPSLTPSTGAYAVPQMVIVTADTPQTSIHYTTSGAEPTEDDPVVVSGGSVFVDRSLTLKAKAWGTNWGASGTAMASYFLGLGAAAAPVAAPPAGTYGSAQDVTLSSSASGVSIRYTLDGTEPTAASPIYVTPIHIPEPVTLKAKAFQSDHVPSATLGADYVIAHGRVAAPVFSPAGGSHPGTRTVTISTMTPDADIHFTTSGAEPTQSDPVIVSGGSVLVDKALVLKARAWKVGVPPSAVSTAVYWLGGALAAGASHSLVAGADGAVWAWGTNASGQLGNGGTTSQGVPTLITGLPPIRAVSAGAAHSLALASDGSVRAWGGNSRGQVGNGTTNPALSPVPVVGLTDIVAVAAGTDHSLALKRDGTVWAWGSNDAGHLGDGSNLQSAIPVQVVGLTGVSAIAAGDKFSLALKTDGTSAGAAWGWGEGASGQLIHDTGARNIPVVLLPGLLAVGAGAQHGIALRSDGSVWTWGANTEAQLGIGSRLAASGARHLLQLTGVSAVAASGQRSAVLRRYGPFDGAVWGWGLDDARTGDGAADAHTLDPNAAALHGATDMAVGATHGLASKRDGTVWSWGQNPGGVILGDPSRPFRSAVPAPIPGFSIVDADALTGDPDGDSIPTWRELELGTNPFLADTNGDGIRDDVALAQGLSATNPDMDGDGMLNASELAAGTDPFSADTDGDGVGDGTDAFPLDPMRWQAPVPVPGDTTPPVITLLEPQSAIPQPPQ